jgi:hypothetical protein
LSNNNNNNMFGTVSRVTNCSWLRGNYYFKLKIIKKATLLILTSLFSFAFFGNSNGQSTCDTTPDPGQTVGRCVSGTTSAGDYAFCRVTAEGPICYFGEPKDPGIGG